MQTLCVLGLARHRRAWRRTSPPAPARTPPPCGRLHGHTYQVEVTLQSSALDDTGFVRDFHELAALKQFIDGTLDHKHLNDVLGHDRTTTEVTCKWLYE